jgi:Terminase small subunit
VVLEPRQQRFIPEYLVDLNATVACRRAGYRGARLGRYSELTAGSLSFHDGVRRRSFPCQSSIKARATRCEVYGDLER